MSTNAAAIMPRCVVWKKTEKNGKKGEMERGIIPACVGGGVNPSIRAAKKYSISSIAMAAQRDERFFFFFLVVYRYSLFFSFS